MRFFFNIFIFFFFTNSVVAQQRSDVDSAIFLINKMIESERLIKSFTFSMQKKERVNGEMVEQKTFTKINKDPYTIYIKQEWPKVGQEVLYNEALYGTKAIINPNGFPWINVSLDPMGSIMRAGQHHQLYNLGFSVTIEHIDYLVKKYTENMREIIAIEMEASFNDRECFKITLENPFFKLYEHTILEGETLISIAEKNHIGEYQIVDLNEGIDDLEDISVGDKIMVPNDYARKLELYLDKQMLLPIQAIVYDDLGLYEQYMYYEVTVDPKIPEEEFTKEFSDYGF